MLSDTPSDLYGAKYWTFSNGLGATPHFSYSSRSAVVDLSRLIEEAEVGTFHVEADRGDRALLLGEVREDRRQHPLDRARLRRESGNAGDVQVRRLGAEEEIGVEVDRRVGAAGAIHADRECPCAMPSFR